MMGDSKTCNERWQLVVEQHIYIYIIDIYIYILCVYVTCLYMNDLFTVTLTFKRLFGHAKLWKQKIVEDGDGRTAEMSREESKTC